LRDASLDVASYWRSQGGDEVDMVIEVDAKLYGIACEVSERPGKSALRGLTKKQALSGSVTMLRGFIACTTEQPSA
jgi:predicted AAA+ superfamily ATPase